MNGQALSREAGFKSLYSLLNDGTTTPLEDLNDIFSSHRQVNVSQVQTGSGPVSVFKVDYGNSSKSFDAPTMDYRGVFMGFDERAKKWFYVRDSFPVSQAIVLHETENKDESLLTTTRNGLKQGYDAMKSANQWAVAKSDQEYEIGFSDLSRTHGPDEEWKVYRKYDGMMTTASVFFKPGIAYNAFISGRLGAYFPDHVIDLVRGLVIVFCSRGATKLAHQFNLMKDHIKKYVSENVLDEKFPKTDFTLVMEACGNELVAKHPKLGNKTFYVLATVTHESRGTPYQLKPLGDTLCCTLKTKELESSLRSMYVKFLEGKDGGADTGEGYVIYPSNPSQPAFKVKYSSFIICHVVKRLRSSLIDRFPIIKERYNISEGKNKSPNSRASGPAPRNSHNRSLPRPFNTTYRF